MSERARAGGPQVRSALGDRRSVDTGGWRSRRKPEIAPPKHSAGDVRSPRDASLSEDDRPEPRSLAGLADDDDRFVGRHLGDAAAKLVERNELRALEMTELAVKLRGRAHVENVDVVSMGRNPVRLDPVSPAYVCTSGAQSGRGGSVPPSGSPDRMFAGRAIASCLGCGKPRLTIVPTKSSSRAAPPIGGLNRRSSPTVLDSRLS